MPPRDKALTVPCFAAELDEEALADIRLALLQGQPLGQGRFGDQICAAVGVETRAEETRKTCW